MSTVVGKSGGVHASGTAYSVLMQIQSEGPGNNPKDSRALTVNVSCAAPTVTLNTPKVGQVFGLFGYTIDFTSTAADPMGISIVKYFLDVPAAPLTGYGAGSSATSPTYPVALSSNTIQTDIFDAYPNTLGPMSLTPALAYAVAFNGCGASTTSAKVPITIGQNRLIGFREPVPNQSSAPPSAAWVSQLEVAGGRGQVVLNGSDPSFPAAGGRVPLAGRPRSGENRVEATLVQATGQSGFWRFGLGAESVAPGSLRVISGEVSLVTPEAVVFRMKGRPGERVVFTFRAGR